MLILASSSPRRQLLLNLLGINFQVIPAEVDERFQVEEFPHEYVARLAHKKALSINTTPVNRQLVIAADTAVVDGNQILGKPVDHNHAKKMLQKLRGRVHHVYTGLAVRDSTSNIVLSDLCVTEVQMRPYHDTEIEDYVSTGDPLDKAGAYAIQNYDFNPAKKITGCYTNVVGLPLCHLMGLLSNLEIKVPEDITRGCRNQQEYSCRLADRIQDFN